MSDDTDKPIGDDPVTQSGEVQVPHLRRFTIITGVLFVLGLAMALGAVIVIGEETKKDPVYVDLSWSNWRPESNGPDRGALEIADYVGRNYRQANGQQLVAVTGGPLEVGGLPVNIALRPPPADKGDISLLPGNGVLYRLCGLGPKCALDRGVPSTARQLLLRREALELALYSFKYLKKKDVEFVAVFLPPGAFSPDEKKAIDAAAKAGVDEPDAAFKRPTSTILFRRDLLEDQLKKPLNQTLVDPAPNPSTIRTSKGMTFVDKITSDLSFNGTIQESNNDGYVFLVLDPASPPKILLGGKTGGNQDLPPGTVSKEDQKTIERAPRASAGAGDKVR